MDIKAAEKFMEKLVKAGMEYGFEECEASFAQDSSMSIDILKGEVSSYENSVTSTLSFRGLKNGQMGYCSTNILSDDSIDFLLKSAMENCEVLNDEDPQFIYCDENNKDLYFSQITDAYSKNTYKRFEELGLGLEKAILALDERIDAVDILSINCGTGPFLIINSKGLHSYRDTDGISLVASGRAIDADGSVKSGGHYWIGKDIDDFDQEKFLKKFKENLIGKMGAKSVKAGSYKTILRNEAFQQFFMVFFGNFLATTMQRGLSLLADKEGTKIASDALTVKECPMLEKALTKIPFDDEGVLTTEKAIIDKGTFATALYDLKSAYKAGRQSTGNGFRAGSAVSEMPTNLVVEPGEKDLAGLMEEVGEGIMLTDLSGLHAGVNAISGDFSLLCEGYLIEGGKKGRPVEQITVAGNFYDVIKSIKSVGNDIINLPSGEAEFFTPSVYVGELAISGDEDEN
ncbi:MAG: TldD/PmbA family protein [Clostridiales bacterium]|nr:TldD/PmbA family protein [Clostridiales bacterium]